MGGLIKLFLQNTELYLKIIPVSSVRQYSNIRYSIWLSFCIKQSMNKKITFSGLWKVLKNCFTNFGKDKIMKQSASLAYYTTFSIGPLLMVAIFLSAFFMARRL